MKYVIRALFYSLMLIGKRHRIALLKNTSHKYVCER